MKKIKEFISMISYCFTLSWKASKFYTMFRLLQKIAEPLLNMFSVVLGKYVVDILCGSYHVENKQRSVYLLIIAIGAVQIVLRIFNRFDTYVSNMHSEILTKMISEKMMNQAVNADLEFFDNSKSYDKFVQVRGDMNSVVQVMWGAVYCISAIISFISTFVIVCDVNLIAAVLLVAITIPSGLMNKKYMEILYRISLEQRNDQRKLDYLYTLLTERRYASDIRLYNIGAKIKGKYDELWNKLFKYRKKITKRKTLLITFFDILPSGIIVPMILFITYRILNGTGTVGDYTLYTGFISQLYYSVSAMSDQIVYMYEHKLRINNVKSFERIKNRTRENGQKILSDFESLEFQNVYFRYPDTERYVLEDVSFSIRKDERIALVGLNGSGKSTIIKLILRLYDVDRGCIKINGEDIKEYDILSIRKIFSTCFQEPTVYGFTIRENIILSDYDQYDGNNDEMVLKALENSDATSILEKADTTLDTYLTRNLNENGIELSGGQYQKLNIARSFYRNSQVIILDEPSASLDPEAEHEVFMRMKLLCENKTVFFTSHRLSNVSMADRIIVLENGRIIEQGTLNELMQLKKRFYVLYNYQAELYK